MDLWFAVLSEYVGRFLICVSCMQLTSACDQANIGLRDDRLRDFAEFRSVYAHLLKHSGEGCPRLYNKHQIDLD